jgi:hypothetical protein
MKQPKTILLVSACVFAIIFIARALGVPALHSRAYQNTPTFHAKGTHMCQSKTSIGHECIVEGDFNDCDEAYQKLKMQDCCSKTKDGGASSGFTLNSCIPH